eukprot:1915291-Lingulodinium_polyedra.AAC.1
MVVVVDVPPAGVYADYVKGELQANGDLDALPDGASARQVAQHFERYGGHVLGLALLRPRFAST